MSDDAAAAAANRRLLRTKIANAMHETVSTAPMTFIADPDIPELLAELIIRAFEEFGWTPPQDKP